MKMLILTFGKFTLAENEKREFAQHFYMFFVHVGKVGGVIRKVFSPKRGQITKLE